MGDNALTDQKISAWPSVSYETAVYVEDVKALTDEIVALIRARTEHLPEGHLRDAIIGASLITGAIE